MKTILIALALATVLPQMVVAQTTPAEVPTGGRQDSLSQGTEQAARHIRLGIRGGACVPLGNDTDFHKVSPFGGIFGTVGTTDSKTKFAFGFDLQRWLGKTTTTVSTPTYIETVEGETGNMLSVYAGPRIRANQLGGKSPEFYVLPAAIGYYWNGEWDSSTFRLGLNLGVGLLFEDSIDFSITYSLSNLLLKEEGEGTTQFIIISLGYLVK